MKRPERDPDRAGQPCPAAHRSAQAWELAARVRPYRINRQRRARTVLARPAQVASQLPSDSADQWPRKLAAQAYAAEVPSQLLVDSADRLFQQQAAQACVAPASALR